MGMGTNGASDGIKALLASVAEREGTMSQVDVIGTGVDVALEISDCMLDDRNTSKGAITTSSKRGPQGLVIHRPLPVQGCIRSPREIESEHWLL